MTRAYAILIALSMVVLFSFNAVEGGAYMSRAALSRKGLKEERKLSTSGVSPSVSSFAAYTPMTATTADSHHDLSVDQYRRIIHNNQMKP
ncbi:hypothetical protein BAE44_0023895 [Dichanthelium oligosanthes]|uniref:Uncharacterized protein n=1 Tax=Dichanthelium oligosanthes TaxID=888268 RepID=A0A1E5UQE0_9POAL|nr:hypothetical protein BAE44_0023895 [Dichanthelium oligosanthes]